MGQNLWNELWDGLSCCTLIAQCSFRRCNTTFKQKSRVLTILTILTILTSFLEFFNTLYEANGCDKTLERALCCERTPLRSVTKLVPTFFHQYWPTHEGTTSCVMTLCFGVFLKHYAIFLHLSFCSSVCTHAVCKCEIHVICLRRKGDHCCENYILPPFHTLFF
jgi:hypothetical protein